ncbi:DgyrCDS4160 [Dimorphilus gyrociliatus]|uniref:DgyrCDS4160 n=1 Tax=Dimorphilus gyrociliatus TaxID=2664684 RepID=A0A7I8VHL0_9ANNE|nr:DgyrCDS4160 [Dimorphilus gyrociliatus]
MEIITNTLRYDPASSNLKYCQDSDGSYADIDNEDTGISYLYKPLVDILKNYTVEKTFVKDDKRNFFIRVTNSTKCLIEGSDINKSKIEKICVCLKYWHGISCSIPDTVCQRRKYITAAEKNRKIVNAFPFSVEFELLDARFSELGDIVDVFLILESTYTAYGEKKPLYLYNQLKRGKYKKYREKIVHVLLDYFPQEGYKNGWAVDNLLRNHLAKQGIQNQLRNLDHDDIFMLNDADELPTRSTALFLKVNKDYPEPIGINLSWRTYGFFYKAGRGITHVITATTIGFLTHVFSLNGIWIRSAPHYMQKESSKLNAYLVMKKNEGSKSLIGVWSFGNKSHPSGWHCSWCVSLERKRVKLVSAQNGDFPRWGDYPEKRNLTYIKRIVSKGLWFDDKSEMTVVSKNSYFYAPCGLLDNFEKYTHILIRPT